MKLKSTGVQLLSISCLAMLNVASSTNALAAESYHLVKSIPVGGEGGWDYLSLDPAGRRLYVSHATKVEVINLDKEEKVGEIADTPGIHGFAVAADLGKGFSSNGRENKVSVVDLKTLKTLSKVETGENPDAIMYEPSHQEIYAFNGRSRSASVIDGKTAKVVATIPLSGKPEFAIADTKAGRVYCNIEDKSEVAVIDIKTHKVLSTWPIAPGEEASGMAFDPANHRLFLGCGNKKMVMMDSASGKVITSVPIGDRVDANSFDSSSMLAFSSNGDGTVTIAHEDSPDKLTVVQTLKTEVGAKTMTLDPTTHKIYLSSAKYETSGEKSEGKGKRPKILAGSFHILVYSP